MDFIERLNDTINAIPSLPLRSRLGYLGTEESLVIYPLPGSNVIATYMDGVRDENLNYEMAMKSKDQEKISNTLWLVARTLEETKVINSKDNSFKFEGLRITNLPFVNNADEQGWFTFLLNVQATITNFEKEN